MRGMSIDAFSADISNKTGYNITPKQIRSYLNGDIEPFPGTINILSNYARVSPDFWYMFNTEDTLALERKRYEEEFIKLSTEQFSKDYYHFINMDESIRDWILHEDNIPYIKLSMEASRKKVCPDSIKLLIDTIENHRGSK